MLGEQRIQLPADTLEVVRVGQRQPLREIRVYPWTVDDDATMRSLIRMGVDGIISNRADLLAAL